MHVLASCLGGRSVAVFGWIAEHHAPPRQWDLRRIGWILSADPAGRHAHGGAVELGDAPAPCSCAQVSLVRVMLLIEGENVCQHAGTFEQRYGVKFEGIRQGPVKDPRERLIQFKANIDVVMSLLERDGPAETVRIPVAVSNSAAQAAAVSEPENRGFGRDLIEKMEPMNVGWFGTEDPFDFDRSELRLRADARRFAEVARLLTLIEREKGGTVEGLLARGVDVPIVGDFHYNGHLLLARYPDTAEALAKYRINPGNVGAKRRDENFATIIEKALRYAKPVRIGVNWGSLDQVLLTEMMNANAALPEEERLDAQEVLRAAMIESALGSTSAEGSTSRGNSPATIRATAKADAPSAGRNG